MPYQNLKYLMIKQVNKQPIITLMGLIHKKKEWIALSFPLDYQLNIYVKQIPQVIFSYTHKKWLTPYTKEHYQYIINVLKPHAIIQTEGLKQYNLQRKKAITKQAAKELTKEELKYISVPLPNLQNIHPINKNVLQIVQQHLQLKGYSYSTRKTYLNEISQFLQAIKNQPAETFTTDRVKNYLVYCYTRQKLSENTLHSRINALKFYYEQVLKKDKFFLDIPRAKKPLQLPNVLAEKDIVRLFNAVKNLKHKAILFTAYSAGLRVSEVVNLKMSCIDSKRMQIKIEEAKGKKDRLVNLSPVLLDVLRKYVQQSNPKPKVYLFENQEPGVPYSSRSAQKVFQRAKEQAGIQKGVTFHSLRHSFATHLLEKGIDIRYIKDILGHFNIKTTERYTHVKKDQLINITSPLDDLWLKGEQIEI